NGATAKLLIENTGIRDSSFYRHLSGLLVKGYISKPKEKGPYFITDKGRKVLGVDDPDELPSHSQTANLNAFNKKDDELPPLSSDSYILDGSSAPQLPSLPHPFRGGSGGSGKTGDVIEESE